MSAWLRPTAQTNLVLQRDCFSHCNLPSRGQDSHALAPTPRPRRGSQSSQETPLEDTHKLAKRILKSMHTRILPKAHENTHYGKNYAQSSKMFCIQMNASFNSIFPRTFCGFLVSHLFHLICESKSECAAQKNSWRYEKSEIPIFKTTGNFPVD